jgi:DNA transformation protein
MAVSASLIEHAKELFEPFGEISIRKMFGGAGVYCDGLFFAILAEDGVFLKVDDATRPEFARAGLAPFVFEMKDGSKGEMSYHGVPDDFYDDADVRRRWTTLALDAAARAAKFRKKPSRRKIGTKPKPKALRRAE